MEALFGLLVLFGIVVLFLGAGLLIAKNLIYVCGPNEALIFSGGRSVGPKGPRGFRVIKGGRSLRIPLLETVEKVDLTNMIIEVSVNNAYSKGGIPLTVSGVANVKVAGHDPALSNAVERFLGMDRRMIVKIAKDTLEGNLRGVLSQLTPEEVNEDKLRFAEKLLDEAEHDLGKLGLMLDTLKIQNVSDDAGYLDSIGRKQSADVRLRARVAEAEASAISKTRAAENNERARVASFEADKAVLHAETQRRIKDAQSKSSAMVAEEVGRVKAAIARANADMAVQRARVEQVRQQLAADVITPAQADMEAAISAAKGASAKVIEDGKATDAVLREMITTWQSGGDNARDIFLMQKLQTVMTSLVDTIQDVHVDRLTVLPSGGEDGTASRAVRLVEELKGAVGVDLPKLLESAVGSSSDDLTLTPIK